MPQTECDLILLHNLCETMQLIELQAFIAEIFIEYVAPVEEIIQ